MIHLDRVLGKRILVADDQQGVRAAIKFLLQIDEHEVTEAQNGKEALELFHQQAFDLVITDYAMPEMAGNELIRRIQEEAPRQPIIMITAHTRELGDCEKRVGAVLNKPFSFIDLRAAIAKLLSGCQEFPSAPPNSRGAPLRSPPVD